jgi:hypothetical protein
LDDYIDAILLEGPVLVGTQWKNTMWNPGEDGFLDTTGSDAGGHCYILRGVDLRKQAFRMTNSWGPEWGKNGEAWISFEGWERDMMPDGEGAVLYEQKLPPTRGKADTSSSLAALETANGLPLGHWWVRGR